MPATVFYRDTDGRTLMIRVRRGNGPIPEYVPAGLFVTVPINKYGDEIERDISRSVEVSGLTFSEKGSLYFVGFEEEQKDKRKRWKRKEHLFPAVNVEWIKREGDWSQLPPAQGRFPRGADPCIVG